jgi:hypothetical protein
MRFAALKKTEYETWQKKKVNNDSFIPFGKTCL